MVVSNVPIMKPFPEGKGEIYDFVVVDETFGDGLFSAIGIPIVPGGRLKNSLIRRLSKDFGLKNVGKITIYKFPIDMRSDEMKDLIKNIESTARYNYDIDIFLINPPQQHWIIDPEEGRVPVEQDDPSGERRRLENIVVELGYKKMVYPNPYDIGVKYVKKL